MAQIPLVPIFQLLVFSATFDVPPDFQLPMSNTTVDISVIEIKAVIHAPATDFTEDQISGHGFANAPEYYFFIQHPSGDSIVFDLAKYNKGWNHNVIDIAKSVLEASKLDDFRDVLC
ncbi:hypothetical protein S40288_02737 [Stachybotrys chartarum IBT 40288]|nr:hypothetical protein S40288_02737 [Stachybotrys chartarum IBT 40288]